MDKSFFSAILRYSFKYPLIAAAAAMSALIAVAVSSVAAASTSVAV